MGDNNNCFKNFERMAEYKARQQFGVALYFWRGVYILSLVFFLKILIIWIKNINYWNSATLQMRVYAKSKG